MDATHDTNTDINNIIKQFSAQFDAVYRTAAIRDKAKLMKFYTHFFRFWYYSALAENTILSPANMIDAIHANRNPFVRTAPVVNLEYDGANWYELRFTEHSYSTDDHPAVRDLMAFIDILSPDAALTKSGFFPAPLERRVQAAVSIKDTYYVEYLFQLAASLGLIKRMASINVNKVQVPKTAHDFFRRPRREILVSMISETINICVKNILAAGPVNEFFINRDIVISILRNPIPTDEIFRIVYAKANELLDLRTEDPQEFDNRVEDGMLPKPEDLERLIMASSYVLGTMLDKYFFTMFGFYLRVIQPLYVVPYDFYYTIEALNAKKLENVITGLYMPCSAYTLTRIGMDVLNVRPPVSENKEISPAVPGALLASIAESRAANKKISADTLSEIGRYHADLFKPVYEIKIILDEDKAYWKRIHAGGDFTLQSLHYYICGEFNLDPSPQYEFFAGSMDNPFANYIPPDGKNRFKLTTGTTLDALGLEPGEKLYYTVNNILDSIFLDEYEFCDILFQLEIIKIKPAGIEYYPQVIKESQAFKETGGVLW